MRALFNLYLYCILGSARGCYECQPGNLKAAWKWLETDFDLGDAKKVKLAALDDPDLEPLWTDISAI
jgi:hypothetical protein